MRITKVQPSQAKPTHLCDLISGFGFRFQVLTVALCNMQHSTLADSVAEQAVLSPTLPLTSKTGLLRRHIAFSVLNFTYHANINTIVYYKRNKTYQMIYPFNFLCFFSHIHARTHARTYADRPRQGHALCIMHSM